MMSIEKHDPEGVSAYIKRLAALEELAATKGASITYAGRLLVAVQVGSEVHLYDRA